MNKDIYFENNKDGTTDLIRHVNGEKLVYKDITITDLEVPIIVNNEPMKPTPPLYITTRFFCKRVIKANV